MKQFQLFVGTLFGAGLLPKAPGTWGSLLTLPFVWGAFLVSPVYGILGLTLITSLLSLWSAPAAISEFGDDPSRFVMDEAAGQSLVFIFTAFHYGLYGNITLLITGFILFRIFDVLKPLGIKRLEKFPGKFGILLDDLLSGVYALVCLELIKGLIAPLLG